MINVQTITALITAHPLISGLAAYYVFAAGVDTLSAPTKDSSKLYVHTYQVLHFFAANIQKALATKFAFVAPDPSVPPTSPQV